MCLLIISVSFFEKCPFNYLLIFSLFYCVFKIYFIDYAITVVPFSPLHSPPPCIPPPTHIPPFSSCLWVIHIRSLASTFPILFLLSPCLFSTYHLCYLFSVPFPPPSPSHSSVDNPPRDLHFCISVAVLVVCFVFVLVLGVVVNNCEFPVILLFIFFLLFLR
ncbi:hypothetical protein HJG60_008618 [Phyllostomus discolor]|uniref:Uncharacterized protein n=1 Tax=Phyllostomus discolor TaxID=89673 RepID=A0A833Z1P2_9CHIR|nr:hypothetical protein HJG60_008618 [Phyllostomus discolor]